MFKEIWLEIIMPDMWRSTTITALYKNKGSRKECKNYRGISIGSSFLKLAMAIILERLRPWYNQQLLPNQNGFRQFFGCPDAIFALNSIHNISSRLNQETYLLFVDLTAAYDWCVRTWLFQSIFNRIDDNHINLLTSIRIMEELYKKTLSKLRDDTEEFQTSSGVRQGGTESPVLFNLFMDYIMRIYNHRAAELGLGISFNFRIKDQARERGDTNYRGRGEYYWLGYADDLVLPESSKENLQAAANLLDELFTSFGLTISIDKTQSMILNFQGHDYPDTIINIKGIPIKNVTSFKYLGAIKSHSEPGTAAKEIDLRIAMATSKFSEMKKLLCNYHINLPIRIKYYEVYVRSRLCYCCETWSLTLKQLSRIESAHVGFLRRMIRGGMFRKSTDKEIKAAKEEAKSGERHLLDNIDWAYKMNNQKIYKITKSVSMEIFIREQNIRWVGHICRSSNETLSKQLMFPDVHFTQRGRHQQTVYEKVIKFHTDNGISEQSFLLENTRKRR